MTKHPSLVAEFIQYDDRDPFDPIILQYAVTDLVKVEDDHGKLTAIVRYLTPYTFNDGNTVLLLFGIGSGVTVPSIIGSPQYTNSAVKKVEAYVSEQSGDLWKLPAKSETP